MNPHLLIGLAGFARSGKTTIASVLERDMDFAHYSFAAQLRHFAYRFFFSIDPEFELERDKNKPYPQLGGSTPRKFMQAMGTEGGRQAVHPDLWVLHTMALIDQNAKGRDVVISDVRFPNEAKAIREAGGIVLWISRPGCSPAEHASEAGLPAHLCHGMLTNDGPVERIPKFMRQMVDDARRWKAWYETCNEPLP